MRYALTDREWSIIRPILPSKQRGIPRVDDRRVLNGIFWVLRSGAPWRDLPDCYGPYTTCYNRFNRWRKSGVWDDILNAISNGRDADIQMVDTSIVRVHQHASCIQRAERHPPFLTAFWSGLLPIQTFGSWRRKVKTRLIQVSAVSPKPPITNFGSRGNS